MKHPASDANAAPIGARSNGITYQALLDTDPYPVPDVLRMESPKFLGSADVPVSRYTSREWHELEVERLWKRVWQFACREEELAEVGSHVVYDIANLSFIVMRSAPNEIKAYYNACLHRGRLLASGAPADLLLKTGQPTLADAFLELTGREAGGPPSGRRLEGGRR